MVELLLNYTRSPGNSERQSKVEEREDLGTERVAVDHSQETSDLRKQKEVDH